MISVSCLTSMVTSPVSSLLSHVFCLTPPVSRLLSNVSCNTSPVSSLMSHISCLTSAVSCFLFPVSCLTSHVSCLTSPVSAMCPTMLNCLATVTFSLLKIRFLLFQIISPGYFNRLRSSYSLRFVCKIWFENVTN